MILRQIRDDTPKIDNEYNRAVRDEGNVIAQKLSIKYLMQVAENGEDFRKYLIPFQKLKMNSASTMQEPNMTLK